MRGRGGYIGANVTPAASGTNSLASGVWTLREAESLNRAGTWPNIRQDPFFSSVSLLLNMNGSNGSTTFTDSSLNGVTMTASASNANISTAQSKYGGASGFFAGTNGRVSGPSSALFAFGTGDFTVEAWVNTSVSSGFQTIFTTRSSNTGQDSGAIWIGIAPEVLTPLVYTTGAIAESSLELNSNTFTHLAVCRASGTLRVFVNGAQSASVSNSTNFTLNNPTLGYTLANEHPLTGYIDDLRVTKGIGRYENNFTPPQGQF